MTEGRTQVLLVRKTYFWFVVGIIGLLAVFLVWTQRARINDFEEYHDFIALESVSAVSEEVSRFVMERNRFVQVFANQHIEAIRAVAKNRYNERDYDRLHRLIKEYFPNHFAFTVANSEGIPYFENFDGLVAESCRADIRSFAEKKYYYPYIHPNAEGYHFDVMTKYGDGEGVLFISFHVDNLAAILKAAQTPGHKLMLTYPALSNLIEVLADGARNVVMRSDYHLSDEEKERMMINMPVTGTRWDVVDLSDPDLFNNFRNQLYIESIIIFSVFLFAGTFMVIRLRREELHRVTVEKQKQELMGVISHEFRTPAAAIHNSLNLIARKTGGPIDEEVKNLVDIASSNTHRLLSLVNDFLDLQKLESGKLEFNKRVCQLRPILERAVTNNKMYAQQFGVTYWINDTTESVRINCDPDRIEQVLANLLSNAAKYGANNDVIEILVAKPTPVKVRVSVIDHGNGIPDNIRDHVFEKFVMARTEKSGTVRSSGLGLSISKAIIEEHDGTIDFESRLREGTTFYFDLPVVPDE